MRRMTARMKMASLAWLVAAAVLGLGLVVFLAVDVDGDGLAGGHEAILLTQPWVSDSDGDGLADGWEHREGLNPSSGDSDGDGLGDGVELAAGADPASRDSDGDGLPDGEDGLGDCDGDGRVSAASSDDDADGYPDGLEPAHKCMPDRDADGVLDGSEGNRLCINKPDCDEDGLRDGQERPPYDPLNADSFGSGIPDGVSRAFEAAGQEPGGDEDDDGIPDAWESGSGLIAWNGLQPQEGRRDLLVEFLVVQGPDSQRYSSLDFTPAYRAVTDALQNEGPIEMSWAETRVTVAAEPVAPSGLDGSDAYYTQVLSHGRHSTNPFVTTVVLNPQHDQSETIHAGVGQLRGMLASVDYGMHVSASFEYDDGDPALSLLVGFESLAIDDRQDLVAQIGGIQSADVNGAGDVVITTDSGSTYTWTPRWFRSAPVFRSGSLTETLVPAGAEVLAPELAQTILHELGHTMGLCHTHEADCRASYPAFSALDATHQASSTMSYDAAEGTLHFLASEWAVVDTYLTCPPVGPLTLLADGADDATILDAKYSILSTQSTFDSRVCGMFTQLPHDVVPVAPSYYAAPESRRDPIQGDGDPRGALLLLGATVLLAAGGAGGTLLVARRRT